MSPARDVRRGRGARSVPVLYGALTAGLVVVVTVVASVLRPTAPPSIAELGPAPRDRIEESRSNQAVGSGGGANGSCAPGQPCATPGGSAADATSAGGKSAGGPPVVEVPAGRRCFGDPPRQTEDPHSPPCVFQVFKGSIGGATARGVTGTEIRIAVHATDAEDRSVAQSLINHFNSRYEFYGRRLSPVFISGSAGEDPESNRAYAEEVIDQRPFGFATYGAYASNALRYRLLAEAGVVSTVALPAAFGSDAVANGLTWLVEPPLDVRLQAGANLVCRAFNGHQARHAGDPVLQRTSRKFAVVVLTEAGARPDPGPLEDGLRACEADFDTFEVAWNGDARDYQTLMLQLRGGDFTTVLLAGTTVVATMYQAASDAAYFPEWLDLGLRAVHKENFFAGGGRAITGAHAEHYFGITPEVRLRSAAEEPSEWAYREGGGTQEGYSHVFGARLWYEPLLVLASGIQGAGPNLTPEKFAQALRSTRFPNPNPGAPPFWQQGIGFGPGDQVFHDDYAVWWWNDDAPSQTSHSTSGRGSFCYLGRGARFTPDSFPPDADQRLRNASEPCR